MLEFFSFHGRYDRLQYWMVSVGSGLVFSAAIVVLFLFTSLSLSGLEEAEPATLIPLLTVLGVLYLTAIWVQVATSAKRFHDRDKSGVWVLIVFVPLIGPFWQLIENGFLAGTPGGNRFGGPRDFSGVGEVFGGGEDDDMIYEGADAAIARALEKQKQVQPAPAAVAAPAGFGRRGAAPAVQQGFGRRGA